MPDNKYKHNHKLCFGKLKGRRSRWPEKDKLLYENSWYGIWNLILNIKGLRKWAQDTNLRGCLISLNNPADNQICSWGFSLCLNGYANPHPWLGCWWIMSLGNHADWHFIIFPLLISGFTHCISSLLPPQSTEIITFSDEISVLPQELAQSCSYPCLDTLDANTTQINISYTI